MRSRAQHGLDFALKFHVILSTQILHVIVMTRYNGVIIVGCTHTRFGGQLRRALEYIIVYECYDISVHMYRFSEETVINAEISVQIWRSYLARFPQKIYTCTVHRNVVTLVNNDVLQCGAQLPPKSSMRTPYYKYTVSFTGPNRANRTYKHSKSNNSTYSLLLKRANLTTTLIDGFIEAT